jgi:energy-coupling factor transporter ATP-binding protein EcfA2
MGGLLNRFYQPKRDQGLNNPNGGQHYRDDHMANEGLGNLHHRNDLQNHHNDDLANPNNGPNFDGLDKLRKEVVERFDGQKILLVGPEGSGKSSLINTFDTVLQLTDPTYQWKEWAVYGPGKTDRYTANPTTFHYRKYHTERLYQNLEKFLGDTPPEKCPTFLDTTGFRRTGKIREDDLLVNIASGNMPEDTELLSIMEGEKKCDDVITEQNKELQSWSIVFVAGASIDFPKEIAHVCYAASEKLERTAKDVRLFAVVTKLDELSPDMRKTRLDEMQQEIEDTLAIPPTRIFHIRNITPEDVNEDETLKVDTDRRRAILRALNGILNPSHQPSWIYKETAAAN